MTISDYTDLLGTCAEYSGRDDCAHLFPRFVRFAESKLNKALRVADIAADPHYAARGMLLARPQADGSEMLVPGIVPKLMGTPGQVRSSAPRLGDDTDAVLAELGYSNAEIEALRTAGAVR